MIHLSHLSHLLAIWLHWLNWLVTLNFTVPPAAKVLAVTGSVYAFILGAKKIPVLTKYLTGWVSVAVNLVLTVGGIILAVPASDLYTTNTALLVLTAALGSAGVQGTVKSMSAPTVLASTPPSTQVKEVPATLVPVDPAAVPAKPPDPPKP